MAVYSSVSKVDWSAVGRRISRAHSAITVVTLMGCWQMMKVRTLITVMIITCALAANSLPPIDVHIGIIFQSAIGI